MGSRTAKAHPPRTQASSRLHTFIPSVTHARLRHVRAVYQLLYGSENTASLSSILEFALPIFMERAREEAARRGLDWSQVQLDATHAATRGRRVRAGTESKDAPRKPPSRPKKGGSFPMGDAPG